MIPILSRYFKTLLTIIRLESKETNKKIKYNLRVKIAWV
jgi:hypothetical protein